MFDLFLMLISRLNFRIFRVPYGTLPSITRIYIYIYELTQTPTVLSPLIDFMTARLANSPYFNSNDETDDETTTSSSEESSDEEISQQLNTETGFQKVFGRPIHKKKNPNPTDVRSGSFFAVPPFTRALCGTIKA